MLIVAQGADGKTNIIAEQIREAIRVHVDSGQLPKWAVPERVEFVEQIDKTSIGKLDKKVLRARYTLRRGNNHSPLVPPLQ